MSNQPTLSQLELFPVAPPEFRYKEINTLDVELPLVGPPPTADLVESVKKLGVLQPIIVKEAGKFWRVIAGRRRIRAALIAEVERVPALILSSGEINEETITLVENSARRANPISEYEAIKRLQERGFSIETIGRELGIKAAVIKQRLNMANLIEPLYNLAAGARISSSVADACSKLTHKKQAELFEGFKEKGRLTLVDIRETRLADRQKAEPSLSELLLAQMGGNQEIKAAIAHLDAIEVILKSIGREVDLSTVRAELSSE